MPRGSDATARIKTAMGLGCGELDKINRAHLPTVVGAAPLGPDGDRSELTLDGLISMAQAWHERLQLASTAKPSTTAEAEIRIATRSNGYVPPQTAYSLVARREAGVWTVYAVSEVRAPEGTNPPLEAPWITHVERLRTVQLTRDKGAALDNALSDRCLWSAPRFTPEVIPLREGGVYACPPHGDDTIFNIRDGERRWSGAQFCRTIGPQRDIERLLFNVVTGEPGDGLNPKLFRTGPSEEHPYGDRG